MCFAVLLSCFEVFSRFSIWTTVQKWEKRIPPLSHEHIFLTDSIKIFTCTFFASRSAWMCQAQEKIDEFRYFYFWEFCFRDILFYDSSFFFVRIDCLQFLTWTRLVFPVCCVKKKSRAVKNAKILVLFWTRDRFALFADPDVTMNESSYSKRAQSRIEPLDMIQHPVHFPELDFLD